MRPTSRWWWVSLSEMDIRDYDAIHPGLGDRVRILANNAALQEMRRLTPPEENTPSFKRMTGTLKRIIIHRSKPTQTDKENPTKPTRNIVIDSLQGAGWVVNIQHFRNYGRNTYLTRTMARGLSIPQADLQSRGGMTVVELTAAVNGKGKTFTGTALCHEKDTFSRRLGRTTAIERALTSVIASADE